MNLLKRVVQPICGLASPRALGLLLTALLGTLIPQAAWAGEGDVVLHLGGNERNYLYVSLVLGVLALLYGLVYLRGSVMAQSPGSAKMQEVSQAIKDGALAYLKQQISTMIYFVVAIAVGLYFLYSNLGPQTAATLSACFVLGVAASYVAGYAGMLMAVNGNARTAHAALSSYKLSLETAFRSGAVAGMVTVGMGLVGATLILLFGGENAMRLLVGFGFGGSLAALFMRVGGGIFTKAADVGADLVGKVEAGIPEDDPRNPATIADNVGDNVGDCAGMAADIFESYEVTLVAAIVLGAATAAIFDQATWTRLILFALMARGVGIIASILGIQFVKGSDDLDKDPLTPIRVGFYRAAVIAAFATVALAYFMMGGNGNPVTSTRLVAVSQMQRDHTKVLQRLRPAAAEAATGQIKAARTALETIAKAKSKDVAALLEDDLTVDGKPVDALKGIAPAAVRRARSAGSTPAGGTAPALDETPIKSWEVGGADLVLLQEVKDLGYTEDQAGIIDGMVAQDVSRMPAPPSLTGFKRVVSAEDAKIPALQYATSTQTPFPGTEAPAGMYQTVASKYLGKGTDRYVAAQLSIETVIPAQPAKNGVPAVKARTMKQDLWVGPVQEKLLDKQIDDTNGREQPGGIKTNLKTLAKKEVHVYVGPENRLVLAVDASGGSMPYPLNPVEQGGARYFEADVPTMEKTASAMMGSMPPERTFEVALMQSQTVPWWTFAVAIIFGLVMAFLIEMLTDYYVSTHKRPVQEVAAVSSTGPAPMIIQGFAYGCESSVFMVFSIVVALLVPLFLFSPALYGTYILSFYGIALVGLGLLTTTGYVLAMDTFGPISDNAQGIFEMSGAAEGNERGAKAVGRLDAAGNTTKALTKGFAIATAVVAAVALFHSYIEDARLAEAGLRLELPEIFLGLLIGGAAPYLFASTTINAVGRSAFELINEVRRQFRSDPGIMAGTSKPDYGRCVAIVTKAAQKELLGPGVLAIFLPVAVAFGFSIGKPAVEIGGQMYNLTGAQALGGYLAGAIVSGQLMAVLLANSGGMWDNSKKLIEDGMFGGKGSENHKASVVCDTVGDPFKDTAGPAMNPLIKVMNLVAVLIAPVVIRPFDNTVLVIVTAISVAILVASILQSKKGSMSQSMVAAQSMAGDAPAIAAIDTATAPKKRLTVEELNKDDEKKD